MTITLQDPLDMHLHLREGAMLKTVAPLSAKDFAAAVVMPNLVEPVDDTRKLLTYRQHIEHAAAEHQFTPLMTLFLRIIQGLNWKRQNLILLV